MISIDSLSEFTREAPRLASNEDGPRCIPRLKIEKSLERIGRQATFDLLSKTYEHREFVVMDAIGREYEFGRTIWNVIGKLTF